MDYPKIIYFSIFLLKVIFFDWTRSKVHRYLKKLMWAQRGGKKLGRKRDLGSQLKEVGWLLKKLSRHFVLSYIPMITFQKTYLDSSNKKYQNNFWKQILAKEMWSLLQMIAIVIFDWLDLVSFNIFLRKILNLNFQKYSSVIFWQSFPGLFLESNERKRAYHFCSILSIKARKI